MSAVNPRKRYKQFLEPSSHEAIPRSTRWRHANRDSTQTDRGSSSTASQSEIGADMATPVFLDAESAPDTGVPLGQRSALMEISGCEQASNVPIESVIDDGDKASSEEGSFHDISERAEDLVFSGSEEEIEDKEEGTSEYAQEQVREEEPGEMQDQENEEDWQDLIPDGGQKLATTGAVTRVEAVLLLLVFFFLHGLTLSALGDLAILVNTLFGHDAVPRSVHKLEKLVSLFSSSATFHFFCPSCSMLLLSSTHGAEGGRKLWCNRCEKWCPATIGKGSNFFATMSIRSQLQRILKDYGSFINFGGHTGHFMTDIRDGKMLRSLTSKLGSSNFLSLLFSTDGSPVFKSSGMSLWPITAFVNQLAPHVRFKLPIVAGVWSSVSSVSVPLFFEAFVSEMRDFQNRGISWVKDGKTYISTVFAVCASPDTLGRASLQNLIRFNGFYGCSWCLHRGKFLLYQVRYPTLNTASPLRSDDTIRADACSALQTKSAIHGVKGPSCLFNVPCFDLVWGFVPDYMHCVCLGVVKMLTEMWVSSKNHAERFYIGQKKNMVAINARLLQIKPPRAITRMPRDLTSRKNWKASEWRAWLLFYSVPCLGGLLKQEFLAHFSLLSSAVYLLLQDSISPSDFVMIALLLLLLFPS